MHVPRRRGRPSNPHTLYRAIQADLRRRMLEGEWAQGQRLPSLLALAKHYKVAKRTLALAVGALKEENFIIASPRRRLIVRRPDPGYLLEGNAILEVISSPIAPYAIEQLDFRALQMGILRGIGELKGPLTILHDGDLRTLMPERFLELSPRGILLVGKFPPRTLKRYEKLSIPVVLCDIPGRNWNLHAVNVANSQTAYETVQRLQALGHRRIAFVRFIHYDMGDADPDSKQREEGFLRALSEAGVRRPSDWVYNAFSSDTPRSSNIQRLLQARPRFTAVLATDAFRARLIAMGVTELGLKIPQDLSLVCFQGKVPEFSECAGPRINFEAMGVRAALLLKAPRRPVQHVAVPAEWHDGETLTRRRS